MKKEKTAAKLSGGVRRVVRARRGFYRKSRLKNSQATAGVGLTVAFSAVVAGPVNAP
ncbi:MAG: hypothetical protein L6Q55_05050 [Azonexus sp.]|nr:hypothetical protein [Azonexus sp.]MCK6411778.1 hypothetical protein [Azonexus sp.]